MISMTWCSEDNRSRPSNLAGGGGASGGAGGTNTKKQPPLWNVTTQMTWASPRAQLNPPGFTWEYRWSTTTFDLRPDLKSQIGNSKQGFAVWDTAARLYVLLTGANGATFDGRNLSVVATDFVQVFDANPQAPAGQSTPNLKQLGATNVSTVFYPINTIPGQGNVLGGFAPPGTSLGGGEGYPVRYWRVEFVFTLFTPQDEPLPPNPTPPAPFVLIAGTY